MLANIAYEASGDHVLSAGTSEQRTDTAADAPVSVAAEESNDSASQYYREWLQTVSFPPDMNVVLAYMPLVSGGDRHEHRRRELLLHRLRKFDEDGWNSSLSR